MLQISPLKERKVTLQKLAFVKFNHCATFTTYIFLNDNYMQVITIAIFVIL